MEHQSGCHDYHDHHHDDRQYNDHVQQRRATPDRVAYFEEDYNNYDDQRWPDDRAARPAPHRHRPFQVPYFDEEELQEFGSPYV
jgi:hypothetical protein